MSLGVDPEVRAQAFSFLGDLMELHGDVVPRSKLQAGFDFRGHRVPLVGPRGIFKPAVLSEIPISITTVPPVEGQPPPYEDQWTSEGFLAYRYRGKDPNHPDNVGLRKAMERQIPLIYFAGIVPGWYAPAFPAFVVSADPGTLTFTVAVDDFIIDPGVLPEEDVTLRRRYVTRLVKQRLHQVGFRQRVIRAYKERCAICRLRHRELLDAAHILPDAHPSAEPLVSNGLSLCRLHHAAFDHNVLGIRPDLKVEIRRDVLEEIDGPMLVHGLQGFQGTKLHVPTQQSLRPNPDFLEERFKAFQQAV